MAVVQREQNSCLGDHNGLIEFVPSDRSTLNMWLELA